MTTHSSQIPKAQQSTTEWQLILLVSS
jgi:hypothetical protein